MRGAFYPGRMSYPQVFDALETQRQFKASYPEIHKTCRETPAGFMHDFDPRKTLEVPKEERLARYEELWAQPGF